MCLAFSQGKSWTSGPASYTSLEKQTKELRGWLFILVASIQGTSQTYLVGRLGVAEYVQFCPACGKTVLSYDSVSQHLLAAKRNCLNNVDVLIVQ